MFVLTPDPSARPLPSAASESTAAGAPLAALHAPPGLSRLLQCSRCVWRRRRDKSGAHDDRYGTVCDVQQACSYATWHAVATMPSCAIHHSSRAGSEHEHGGSCGLIHRARMGCIRLQIAKSMRASLDNGGERQPFELFGQAGFFFGAHLDKILVLFIPPRAIRIRSATRPRYRRAR